jgi:uncharacterized protein (TIGR03067 family)
MRAALLLTLAALAASAAPVPKQLKKPRPDAEVFVGAWETVEAKMQDKPLPRAVWTFDAELKMQSRPLDPKETWKSDWVVRLDPEKSPKQIDLTSDGTNYHGIYEIDGDEIRVVCSGQRPTSFEDKGKMFYTVLRRVK